MATTKTSLADLMNEFLPDHEVGAEFEEARLRRALGNRLAEAAKDQGVSLRSLAELMGTSKSQAQRVLNRQRGGSLTLTTLVRAARALGFRLEFRLKPLADRKVPKTAELGDFAWHSLKHRPWSVARLPSTLSLEVANRTPGEARCA